METFLKANIWIIILVALWQIPWTGYALWLSARTKRKWWFIILLLTNTVAILEIIYIFFIDTSDENIFHNT